MRPIVPPSLLRKKIVHNMIGHYPTRRGTIMQAIYTATATASGDGRNGRTESEDGLLAVDVRIPKEMGGPGGATNPEQLFAAGTAACFHSALHMVPKGEGVDTNDSAASARVSTDNLDAGGF